MTHLTLTTAKPGEAQTPQNTAGVTYPGSIRPRPYSQPPQEVGEIVTNKEQSIAVVHFVRGRWRPDADDCPLYVFLSTRNGLRVLPDFERRVSRFLATKPVKHNDGSHRPLHIWTPRQLYVMTITGRTLDFRVGAAEVTEGTAHLALAEDGRLTFLGYEEEGE